MNYKRIIVLFSSFLSLLSLSAVAQISNTKASGSLTLTDAQIVHVMKTMDQEEQRLSKMAKSKSKNQQVQDFAKEIMNEYHQSEKEVTAIGKKINVKDMTNDLSNAIKDTAEGKARDFKIMDEGDFNREYIDLQVNMHKDLLNDLDKRMIPATQSPDLKSYLQSKRAQVQDNLSKAQEIQKSLVK
jgi:putative membrane protein